MFESGFDHNNFDGIQTDLKSPSDFSTRAAHFVIGELRIRLATNPIAKYV